MSQSAMSKAGFGSSTPVTTAFEFNNFTGGSVKPHLSANGLRGTRSHIAERTIEGPEEVQYGFDTFPNPEECAAMLPIAGFAATGTTFNLTEALTAYAFTFDKVAKVPSYSASKCNSLTVMATKGSPWKWSWDMIGAQETDGDAATFPSLSLTESQPFALHHGVFTIGGSARSVVEFSMKIDHLIEAQTNNNTYADLIEETDRIVTVELTLPYTAANTDLKNQAVAGAAGSAVFTNGNYSCTFTFGRLQFPRGAVEIQGKSGIMLRLSGQARMTGSTRELVIVLDSTP